jgi:hypothetical protein
MGHTHTHTHTQAPGNLMDLLAILKKENQTDRKERTKNRRIKLKKRVNGQLERG